MKPHPPLAVIRPLRPAIGGGTHGRGRRVPLSLWWRRAARRNRPAGPPVIHMFSFKTALAFNIHLHAAGPTPTIARSRPGRFSAPLGLAAVRPRRDEGVAAATRSPPRPAAPGEGATARSVARRERPPTAKAMPLPPAGLTFRPAAAAVPPPAGPNAPDRPVS
ncbi:MAG: hypothetical protein JWO81_2568, partial [Alphaproteobacteria bacterium]|nr:hypothetical protein [Alphaproteobacteria bacterium]